MQKFAKTLCFGIVVAAMSFGASAKAEPVTFLTIGRFTGGQNPGSEVYVDATRGISIAFVSSLNNVINEFPTLASFGQFDTSGTTATSLQGVSSGFELDIIQTGPTAGQSTFLGTLQGSLQVLGSQAFVQFSGPLTRLIGGITYQIVSADSGTMGRVNIAPPTTNFGLSTIQGQIVPEPSSVALVSLGCVALLTMGHRSRRMIRKAA